MSRIDFTSAEDVYGTLGAFITDLVRSPGFGQMIFDVGIDLELDLQDPSATIAIHLTGEQPEVIFGEENAHSTAIMGMPASTAHSIFLGRATFVGAMERGELVMSDDSRKFVSLLPALAFAAFPRYITNLEEAGRSDLL